MDISVRLDSIYKKFRKGQLYDSLRDFIPAVSRRLLRRGNNNHLKADEFWALSDISVDVRRGEALGIIGFNGAGKSTLLKILTGLLQPTRGSLEVHGKLSALIEVGAGFHPDLTGRENIFLYGTILGMKRAEIAQKFDDIVAFSDLSEFIDTPVKRYSSGMYARLGFSVAAHVDPDILIVDEVLSVGDFQFQKKCGERMSAIRQRGTTVLFVSHNLRAVAELCERCILLDHGKMLKEGPTREVITYYRERGSTESIAKSNTPVVLGQIALRADEGESQPFHVGQRAFFDVEIAARAYCSDLCIWIRLVDEQNYVVFDASSERLGHRIPRLDAGERIKCTFELQLHLAPGTYYFFAAVYRLHSDELYDRRVPAATLYVSADVDVKGVATLYPKCSLTEVV